MTTTHRARRPLVAGLALAGLYLVAAVVTLVVSDRPFRPLFDGLAPPQPYRWVNPPPEAARDNQEPIGAGGEFLLGPGSPFINVTPTDGQLILLLEDNAVPPHPPDTGVGVTVMPLDVLTLGPLPATMTPQSNAYQVVVNYAPSNVPVSDFKLDTSSIALVGAGNTDVMLYSRDGQSWERRPTTPLGASHGLETEFAGAGWYVVTSLPTGGGGGTSPVVIGLVLILPPVLVGGLVLRSRRAKARAAAAAAAAAAKRRAQPRKGGQRSKRRRR